MQTVIALRDLPTLRAKSGDTLTLPPATARLMLRRGKVRLPDAPAAEGLPAPLPGSPTGEDKPASSSARGRPPKAKTSSKPETAPGS